MHRVAESPTGQDVGVNSVTTNVTDAAQRGLLCARGAAAARYSSELQLVIKERTLLAIYYFLYYQVAMYVVSNPDTMNDS